MGLATLSKYSNSNSQAYTNTEYEWSLKSVKLIALILILFTFFVAILGYVETGQASILFVVLLGIVYSVAVYLGRTFTVPISVEVSDESLRINYRIRRPLTLPWYEIRKMRVVTHGGGGLLFPKESKVLTIYRKGGRSVFPPLTISPEIFEAIKERVELDSHIRCEIVEEG